MFHEEFTVYGFGVDLKAVTKLWKLVNLGASILEQAMVQITSMWDQ
jgi:hypothetical protein